MALSGSVDFVIKATDLTTRPTQEIISALGKLDEAQRGVIDSSGNVAKSTAELVAEQEALLKVTNELDKRLGAITAYEKNEQKIKELGLALDSAKSKYSSFAQDLFKAQDEGSKSAITTATSNLKAANTTITQTQSQLAKLEAAQVRLRDAAMARGGVDLTQGGLAREATQAARDTAEHQRQLNIQLQQYAAEKAQETAVNARAEAAKQAKLKETADFQKQLDTASSQNQRNEYAQMYAALLDEQDAKLKKVAEQEQVAARAAAERAVREKEAADQLQRFQEIGARANVALDIAKQGQTTPAVAGVSTSASTAVQGALNPLQAQLSTLSGVETALTQVEAKIKDVGMSSGTAASKIETLNAQEKQLDQISKSLGSQAGFIDKLNTQNAAVDLARQRMEAAELEVRKWATAIEQAKQPNQALVALLQQAQGRLQGATTSFNTQSTTLARMSTEARAAGVNVDKLAQEEQRLTGVAQRTAAAQRTVGDALESASKKGDGLISFFQKYNSGGRTTLSFTQRLRGEVLSLTASYLGLQAAVRGVGAVLDSVNTAQAVKAQIVQTTDTPSEAKSQYDFLMAEAVRTSSSFQSVAEGYRMMVRQAREFGLSQNAVNQIFHDSLTVARSYNQTQEQFEGTMLALGQIFDKTTIQAEEIKRQFSNTGLAGVIPVLAKVMKDQGIKTVRDLTKAMQEGTVSAANMNAVMHELAEGGGKAFEANMNTWVAQVARFRTQLFVLENQFAESGFLTGVSEGLDKVSKLLADPETQENIRKLGEVLGNLISGFVSLATNVDVLKGIWTAFEVFLTSKLIIALLGVYVRFGALATATGGLASKIPALRAAFGITSKAGLWGAIVGTGIALGILIDKIPGVENELGRLANANFWDTFQRRRKEVGLLAAALTALEKAVTIPGEALGEGAAQVVYSDSFWGGTEKEEAVARKALEANTNALRKVNAERKAIMAKGAKQTQADIDRLKQLAEESKKIVDESTSLMPKSLKPGAGSAVSKKQQEDADKANAALNEAKLKSLEQGAEEAGELALKIQHETNKKELRSQKDFLRLYQEQYKSGIESAQRSVDNIQKLPKTEDQKKALATATKNLADLQNAIKARADEDYRKFREQEGQKSAARDEAFARKETSLHDATNALMLASDRQLAELTAKVEDSSWEARKAVVDAQIAEINQKYQAAIDRNNLAIVEGSKIGKNVSQLQSDNATLQGLQAQLDSRKKIAEVIAEQKFNLDVANTAEDKINEKLKLRSALLSAIEEQQKAGAITPDEAQARTRDVNARTLGGPTGVNAMIDAQVASLTALINKQKDGGAATEAYTQKLELMRAEMIALKAATDASAVSLDPLTQEIGNLGASAIQTSLQSFVEEVGKAGAAVEGIGQAWAHTRDAMRTAIADMLQKIAVYLIQVQIAKALSNWGNSLGGTWGNLLGAASKALGSSAHTGALVGAGGIGGATPRLVNPAWFIGAPRFHTGGMPGLAPDEYPIIAQKGEEILSKDSPRNVKNGGADSVGGSSQVGAPGGDINLHMHADAGSFFSAGLNTRRGQKDFFLFFEANKAKFSRIVK